MTQILVRPSTTVSAWQYVLAADTALPLLSQPDWFDELERRRRDTTATDGLIEAPPLSVSQTISAGGIQKSTPAAAAAPSASTPRAVVTKIVGKAYTDERHVIEGEKLVWTVHVKKSSQKTFGIFSISGLQWNDLVAPTFTNGVKREGSKLFIPANVSSFEVIVGTVKDYAKEATELAVLSFGGVTSAQKLYDWESRTIAKLLPAQLRAEVTLIGGKMLPWAGIRWKIVISKSDKLQWLILRADGANPSTIKFSKNVSVSDLYVYVPPGQDIFYVSYQPSPPTNSDSGRTSLVMSISKTVFSRDVWSYKAAMLGLFQTGSVQSLFGNRLEILNTRRKWSTNQIASNTRFSSFFDRDNLPFKNIPALHNTFKTLAALPNATISQALNKLEVLANSTYIQIKTLLMIKADSLLKSFDNAIINVSFAGNSSDVLRAMQDLYDNVNTYVGTFIDRFIDFNNQLQTWFQSMPQSGAFALEHFAVSGNFTSMGWTIQNYFSAINDRISTFSAKVKVATDEAIATFVQKSSAERKEMAVNIALGAFAILSTLGSLGFLWSNGSATINQLNDAMRARNSSHWKLREFFTPRGRGTWLAGNGPASLGSLTLFLGNTTGAIVSLLRVDWIKRAQIAGWSDVKLGTGALDVVKIADEMVTAIEPLTRTIDDLQLKLFQYGAMGDLDEYLGGVKPHIANSYDRLNKFITLDDAKSFFPEQYDLHAKLEKMALIWFDPTVNGYGDTAQYLLYGLPAETAKTLGKTFVYNNGSAASTEMSFSDLSTEQLMATNYTAGTVDIQDARAGQSVDGLASEAGDDNADPALTGAASSRLAGVDLATAARSIPPLWTANSLSFANELTG